MSMAALGTPSRSALGTNPVWVFVKQQQCLGAALVKDVLAGHQGSKKDLV